MEIRDATPEDWSAIWPVYRAVVVAADTIPYDPATPEPAARAGWMAPAPMRTLVAVDGGRVVGTAQWGPNHAGPGGHVASATFMVDPSARRRGAGRALGEAVLERARAAGFRIMKFNAVVEVNEPAVALWTALGFRVLGTIPGAFEHPVHGPVGLHVMWRPL